jgi:hypothetical protein
VVAARVLEEGRTPEQWVKALAEKGFPISERSLRAKARELGACRLFGKTMILLPEHVDLIIAEPDKWPSKSTSERASGGERDDLLMATDMSEEALKHLTQRSRTPKSASSKMRRAPALSLVRTPQS